MEFKAVIFDLDGTLLNTLEDIADSMNCVLSYYGFPNHDLDKYKILVGMGMKNLVTMAIPEEYRDSSTIEKAFSMMFEEYSQRWHVKTHLYEGMDLLLDSLTNKGVKMAVLSNKVDHITQLIAKKFLYKWKFEAVFGEREGIPRKPHPHSLLEIANIFKIIPASIILLGDSGSDMTAAINANMYPVGALWGFRDSKELLEHGARDLINAPQELLKYF